MVSGLALLVSKAINRKGKIGDRILFVIFNAASPIERSIHNLEKGHSYLAYVIILMTFFK